MHQAATSRWVWTVARTASALARCRLCSNRRDALGLSADVLTAIERRIATELEVFLIPVEDTVNLIAEVLQNTALDPKDRAMLEPLAAAITKSFQ